MFRNSEWGGIWGRDYDYDWWLFEALELEIVWTRARDEPDVKSGEVLQAAVQTISSQAKAGYSNSQQKGTLRTTSKERRNEQTLIWRCFWGLKNLKEGGTILLISIQDLRSIQERCEIGELVQRLDVSIDRLTVIWDTDTGPLRRIFKNLKQAISTRVDSFEIHDNVRDDVFTLAKDFNEYDSINIIFFPIIHLWRWTIDSDWFQS